LFALFFAGVLAHSSLAAPKKGGGEKMEDGWITEVRNSPEMKKAVKEWRDIGFEIFMHWSAGTAFQGRYNAREINRDLWGEWIMKRARIPVKAYEETLKSWNPKEFNPKEWADIIESSGAKMLVYISKHHDGFAQFKSKANNYNFHDWGVFHRDVFGELSAELHKRGIKTGFYYSHGKDWRNNTSGDAKLVEKYFNDIVYVHLKELNEKYGHQTVCWFDLGAPSKKLALGCVKVLRKTNPNIVISSRIGFGLGDFSTGGDGYVPPIPKKDPWETCMTFDYHWAWYPEDRKPKSPRDIIRMLARIRARGGNLLLNIGPDVRGEIPFQIKTCLAHVGDWLKLNGDAIYAANYIDRGDFPWGVCTVKPGKLFLHVLHLPTLDYLFVPGVKSKVLGAYILADKKKKPLKIEKDHSGNLKVFLYDVKPELIDYNDTVVVLKYEGGTCEVDKTPTLDNDLPNVLLPHLALNSSRPKITATSARLTPVKNNRGVEEPEYFEYACGYGKKGASSTWTFNSVIDNFFYINLKYANHTDKTLKAVVSLAGRDYNIDLPPTLAAPDRAWDSFKVAVSSGPVLVKKGNGQKLVFRLADESLNDAIETKSGKKIKSKFLLQSLTLVSLYPPIYEGYGGNPHTTKLSYDTVDKYFKKSKAQPRERKK
jgi:alpha-L-fucosidase